MPAIVELRSGQTVEFPDEATPEQMQEALRRDFPTEFQSDIEIAPGNLELNPAASRAVDLQTTTRGGAPLSVPEGALQTTLAELGGAAGDVLRLPRNVGGTMGFAGDVVRAGVADIASNVAGTEFAGNIPAVFTGEPLPVDQALDDASEEQARQGGFPWATVLGRTSQGMAKLAPKLVAAGVVGGPTLLGQSAAAGGLFGLDDEGNFHPKEAAFAALFPVVGKAGRMAAAGTLSQAALSGSKLAANPTAQKAVELAADNAAQFAYATATQAPDLIKLSQEDPQAFQQSLGELIAMQLGFSLLGARHLRGEVPSETQRWIENKGQEMAVKLATDQKYADSIDAAVIEAMNPKNGRAVAAAPPAEQQLRPTAKPSGRADEQLPPTPETTPAPNEAAPPRVAEPIQAASAPGAGDNLTSADVPPSPKTFEAARTKLADLWPELSDTARNNLLKSGEGWSDFHQREFQKLSPERQKQVQQWLEANDGQLFKLAAEQSLGSRMEQLRGMTDANTFATELVDLIRNQKRYDADTRQIMEQAGNAARVAGLDAKAVRAAVQREFVAAYGKDAPEMVGDYFKADKPVPAKAEASAATIDKGESEVLAEIEKIKSATGPLTQSEWMDLVALDISRERKGKLSRLGQAEFDNLSERLKAHGRVAPAPAAQQYKVGDKVMYQGKEVKITKAVSGSEFVGIGKRAVPIKEIQPVPATDWAVKYTTPDGRRGEWRGPARDKAEAFAQVKELGQPTSARQISPPMARGATAGMGDPMGAPIPATPPPTSAPGTTMLFDARLPVTLDRTAPGSVSVPQIMESMQNVLRAAGSDAGNIRTGRFGQMARGIWKPHEEIIRLAAADNIPTATHEIGHGLQQKIYGTALAKGLKFFGPAIRRELIGMGKALYGSRKPVAGYTGEGFAEFARYWLTTEDAAKVAPNLTKFFEQTFLPAHPEVAKALNDARDLVSIWRAQGSVERANRQLVREPGALKRMAEALGKLVSYQAQFESGAPIEAISKAAAKKLGRSLNPSEDPFKLFSWKRGTAGATVERMATEHMLDLWGNPVGPSLAEALAPVKGKRNEFLLYVFAQAAEMRWKQNKNPGISLPDAQHIKALYDSPEFRLAADKYRKWNDQLLDYVVQADPAMADAVKAMRGANDYYAPLARMIDPKKAKSAAASAQGNSMQRMFGSGLPVKDIFDQTFINAARLVNRANRSLVARSIVKLAEVPGLGHIVEEVPRDRVREQFSVEQIRKQLEDMGVDTTMIPQDEILQYYSLADTPKGSDPIVAVKDAGGKQRWYQVDPRLYDQLEGLQKFNLRSIPHVGVLADIFIGMPARAFKLGTTGLRPSFSLVTNPTRDLATLLAQSSQNPAKMAAMYPAALKEAITGGPYKDAFFDLGAHLGQPLGQDIGHTKRVSKELFHGRIMKVVTNPVDHIRELLSITESAPRIAELRAVADDIGWKPGTPLSPDQAVQLALAAKRITTDFSAAGDVSRIVNEAVPFFNPALQGARAFARAYVRNPARATLIGLTLFTVPALLNWWRNKDKEWYAALPWREKYLYTNVDDGKNVWQIPRPFEWGNAFQVIPEALFDSWYRQEPEAAKQALSHIFESSNPVDLPVLGKIAKEQWSNRIAFWDRPIVPRGEVDLPPSEQVGPYTSKLAIGINKAFPELSPRRVDAAIRGYFGGAGTDVMQLLGLGANKMDRDWEASDFPVFGSIFRRGGEFNAQNQHINDFWETYLPSRARVDGFNFAKSQAEQGLRKPETVQPPNAGDVAAEQIGGDASQAIRLYTSLASRTKDTKARAELYRQAGAVALQATTAIKNAQRMYGPKPVTK